MDNLGLMLVKPVAKAWLAGLTCRHRSAHARASAEQEADLIFG